MKKIHLLRHPVLAILLLALGGCAMQSQWQEAAHDTVLRQDLGGLPYHPLVYHLDLCILSYQLYGQSLVWPFDPYYEESNNWQWDRAKFMEKVRGWAKSEGVKQVDRDAGLGSYRGPGMLGGFEDNPNHDPILFRYDRLHPRSHTITNAAGKWIEYMTPKEITDQIRDIYVCYRKTGGAEGELNIERLPARGNEPAPGARDVLLAFEGGTGDKGNPGQPASQSLMGFVLLRHLPGKNRYDVHVAFRGSRSGSASRAFLQGNWTHNPRGNPDWITDLGYTYIGSGEGGGHIATTGKVSRGFAYSMKSILPQVFRCLAKVAELEPGPPERIFVTGHSLGGALAQHFTSAVLLGDRYGPGGRGNAMPAALRTWPWEQIKLITFGAPRAGDELWARTLTERGLESEVFSTPVDPYDRAALPVAHPSIVPRLGDRNHPAGYRVVLTKDPITTSKVIGGKHVGKSVYLNEPRLVDLLTPHDSEDHEPVKAREFMLKGLEDPRIPPTAWRYRALAELSPERDEKQRGNLTEFEKLKTAIEQYYRDNDMWFDESTFSRDYEIFTTILKSD